MYCNVILEIFSFIFATEIIFQFVLVVELFSGCTERPYSFRLAVPISKNRLEYTDPEFVKYGLVISIVTEESDDLETNIFFYHDFYLITTSNAIAHLWRAKIALYI